MNYSNFIIIVLVVLPEIEFVVSGSARFVKLTAAPEFVKLAAAPEFVKLAAAPEFVKLATATEFVKLTQRRSLLT